MLFDRDPNELSDDRHGSARWGWLGDLRDANMLGNVFDADHARWPIARTRVPIKAFWAPKDAPVVIVGPEEGNELALGPPGYGKFSKGAGPLLLNDDDCNVIVIDPASGELTSKTKPYRATLGDGAIIDPLGVFNVKTASLNPLDLLRKASSPETEAKALAIALIPPSGAAADMEWVTRARDVVAPTLIFLVEKFGAAATLAHLSEISQDDWSEKTLQEMAASKTHSVRFGAKEIISVKRSEKTWASIKLSIAGGLSFLSEQGAAATLATTSFNPRMLRAGRFSLYIVLPNNAVTTMMSWLRLIYSTLMFMVGPGDPKKGDRNVHVVIDEFPALGRFDEVFQEDLPRLRKFGIRFHLYVQNLAQLQRLYGDAGLHEIVGACDILRVFGASDPFTAEYVSNMLGTTTVKSTSFEGGRSRNDFSPRPLMTPGEVIALPRDEEILILGGRNPFKFESSPVYETQPWKRRLDDWKSRWPGPRA